MDDLLLYGTTAFPGDSGFRNNFSHQKGKLIIKAVLSQFENRHSLKAYFIL